MHKTSNQSHDYLAFRGLETKTALAPAEIKALRRAAVYEANLETALPPLSNSSSSKTTKLEGLSLCECFLSIANSPPDKSDLLWNRVRKTTVRLSDISNPMNGQIRFDTDAIPLGAPKESFGIRLYCFMESSNENILKLDADKLYKRGFETTLFPAEENQNMRIIHAPTGLQVYRETNLQQIFRETGAGTTENGAVHLSRIGRYVSEIVIEQIGRIQDVCGVDLVMTSHVKNTDKNARVIPLKDL